jgi:hypothetical protein
MLGQEPRGRGHRCKAWTAVLVVVCVHLCRPWGAVGQRRVPPSFTSHRTAVQGAGEEAGRRARTPPTFTPARESGRAGGGVGSSSGASGNTPRPAASLVEERDLDEFSWAQTPAGLVAFDPAGCPCSTCLSTYGEALPDFPVLFAHILQPGGAAIVVGNGCGALPLVLAGLVRGHGQVLVYDAASRALEASLARKQNAAAARVVTLQRVCLRAPVDLSPDRVWGAAPACLKGYVGRVCDGNLSPTPAHTVWPWHDHQIQEGDEIASRRGPGKVQLVVISLEPHELAGFVAGLPLSLLLGGSCTLVIHCDYDAQVSVLRHDMVLPRPPLACVCGDAGRWFRAGGSRGANYSRDGQQDSQARGRHACGAHPHRCALAGFKPGPRLTRAPDFTCLAAPYPLYRYPAVRGRAGRRGSAPPGSAHCKEEGATGKRARGAPKRVERRHAGDPGGR